MKSTDQKPFPCELWNERQASLALEQDLAQTRQSDLRAVNREAIRREEEASKDTNRIFWRGVMRFITHMTLAMIVIYTIIHFAGKP